MLLIRNVLRKAVSLPQTQTLNFMSTVSKENLFFNSEVQALLKKLTGLNYEKVYSRKKLGNEPQRPIYQFMTDEELNEAMVEVEKKANVKLVMPPVMEERSRSSTVLEKDEMLSGFDTSKYVFTDISFGIPDRSRIIVVREVDGTLRTANWDEQDRLNHTYFPREGRRHYVPAMFEVENLTELLEPSKYEQILERNCLQYEPDHPIYKRTCTIVFDHINEHRNFDVLHSTRHYGPMVFNFCWDKKIDELLAHLILNDRKEEASECVRLYTKIHTDCKTSSLDFFTSTSDQIIESFIKYESNKASKLNMALEKLRESKETKKSILSGHGAN